MCYNGSMSVSIHASARTIQRFKQVQALLKELDPEAAPQAIVVPGSPVPRGWVIVFPGSFNPPTTAHLALLRQARHLSVPPTTLARLPSVRWDARRRDFAHLHPLSPDAEDRTIHLYAAISKHTIDKETVERPLLLDRVMLLDTVLHRHLRNTGILLFNRGLYLE